MSVINLGGVDFQDFEIPNEIDLGGAHAGKLWKLPGGQRIFDAQGPDDDPIKWAGRFRGSSALSRATLIDSMRRGGQQQQFTVLGLSYSCYIKHFSFKPKHALEIPYSIELEVLLDQGQGISSGFTQSLDTLVSVDLTTGTALAAAIDPGTVAALAAFAASVTTATPLAAASFASLIPVKTAGNSLITAIDSATAALDAQIVSNPLLVGDLGIASLTSVLTALNNESALLAAQGYLGRAVVNVENATG